MCSKSSKSKQTIVFETTMVTTGEPPWAILFQVEMTVLCSPTASLGDSHIKIVEAAATLG